MAASNTNCHEVQLVIGKNIAIYIAQLGLGVQGERFHSFLFCFHLNLFEVYASLFLSEHMHETILIILYDCIPRFRWCSIRRGQLIATSVCYACKLFPTSPMFFYFLIVFVLGFRTISLVLIFIYYGHFFTVDYLN